MVGWQIKNFIEEHHCWRVTRYATIMMPATVSISNFLNDQEKVVEKKPLQAQKILSMSIFQEIIMAEKD